LDGADQQLLQRSETLLAQLPEQARDGYWHLLHYRVAGAAHMNAKWLYMQRYAWHQRQGRASAYQSYELAWEAFRQIWEATQALGILGASPPGARGPASHAAQRSALITGCSRSLERALLPGMRRMATRSVCALRALMARSTWCGAVRA